VFPDNRSIIKLAFLILALALMTSQSHGAEVISSSITVPPSQTFDINITIDPLGEPIAGAQLNLEFNSSLLIVNTVREGDLFTQNGALTFFNSGVINNSRGTVVNIFNAIIGNTNVSSPGTFIIINMTAVGLSGYSGINLTGVKISDPSGSPVAFTVTNGSVRINNPPVLATIGSRNVDEGMKLAFTVSASDPDGDYLTYSAVNLPSGASFDPSTRTFQWTPDFAQSGTYEDVRFEVSDGIYTDHENITITVNDVYPRYDVDENGMVDIADLVIIGQHFNEIQTAPYPRYDVNMDGIVNILDITIAAQHFGEKT
jgi:hypothetical protein